MPKYFLILILALLVKTSESRDSLMAQPVKTFYAKHRGYMGSVELRSLVGFEKTYGKPDYCPYCPDVETAGEGIFSLGLKTVHGWRFSNYLFTGAGVAVERNFAHKQTFVPVFAQLQSEFLKTKIAPLVSAEIGYSFLVQEKRDAYISYMKSRGGIYFGAALGARIYTRSRGSLSFTVGYVMHKSSSEWKYEYSENILYSTNRFYQRLSMGLGVAF